ncbi:TPA: hypothetical protein JDY61_13030, partial [Clostridioides difficile]|nr:hypothetical protein [Clostridioides difficile]
SNRKITELQNIDIDNIVKELIISDNPENKEIYQKMIIITKSFFKIIEYRRKLSLSNQTATDNLMEEVKKLYNTLPKESRYDAAYKNLRKLKEDIEFKIKEIDNYKEIYKREVIKNCKLVSEYKKKEEKLKKSGYIEESEKMAKKYIDIERQFNESMRKKWIYIDMYIRRKDLEIEEMDMKKYEDDNITNSMIKLAEEINS